MRDNYTTLQSEDQPLNDSIQHNHLPAPDPDQFNLSIPFATFGAVPFDLIAQEFDRVGITNANSRLLYISLFGLLDWKKTVRISCHDFMLGITGYLSDKAMQKVLGCKSHNTARDAMKRLLDTELVKKLDKEKGHKCCRYEIALFGPILESLKQTPPETVKVEYLAKNDVFNAKLKHTQKDNPKPKSSPETMDAVTAHNTMDAVTENMDAKFAANQESFKIETPDPTPPLDLVPVLEPTFTAERGEEVRLDQSESKDKPDGADLPQETQEKASQREKHGDLPFNEVLKLVCHWLGESNEFTPDAYRLDLAHQFHTKIHKYVLPAAVRHVPDDPDRTQACIDVMKVWIDKVKSRRKPAKYPNFIDTGPGMTALTEAMQQVLGGIVSFAEMEMDPTLVELYEAKWGENWREKHREAHREANRERYGDVDNLLTTC